ncbi:carbohydrate-binding protein [uncultured Aquimarina sp.]|uniref:carbohydrate-binding protein n=1 Tax=uncultured Aquimarina sp. TaxID=575652 RepID=UPI00261BE03E|nr:carbohydrate-binding protein [uncultured Aquimarina sp.]
MNFLTHFTNNSFVKNQTQLLFLFFLCTISSIAQDWNGIPVPANAGQGNVWELQPAPSDDFNYTFNETNQLSNFGNNKWYNFYHNGWDGPGTTYWKYNHVSVDGNDLILRASRWNRTGGDLPITGLPDKMGRPNDGVSSGCITGNTRVKFPVFVEASVSVADIVLASDVWLLSPDDTQEIDIIECYGGDEQGNEFFSEFIHLSHHSFIRNPFTDYQPRDFNSWWSQSDVSVWGEHHWNNGNRRYVRIGVNWISPFHFEYYIDGNLVRVLYDKAVATNRNGTWTYAYPTMTNGQLDFDATGFQQMTEFATGTSYSFQTLQQASNTSSVSIIDPFNFQGGNGFTKEMDIIINVESQDWHVLANRTPTDADLSDPAKNTMKVDWIRVYKPVGGGTNVPVTGVNVTPANLTLVAGTTGNLTGAVTPANATTKTMTFTSSNTSVATVTQSGVVTAVSAGMATITVNTTDGNFTDTATITVTEGSTGDGQTPFGGSPHPIPGTINSVDFDNGGQGIAYNDSGSGNNGTGPRQNTDVDTEFRTPAGNIGWISNGEWLEYTVNVATAGTYTIDAQVASINNNGAFHIEFNGNDVTGLQSVGSTGNWGSFVNKTISNVSLPAGQQIMRVFMDRGRFNLGSMNFTATGGGTSNLIIEAEDFTGTGGTYDDTSVGGPGLGVNRRATTINYVNNGDWAEYAVTIPTTGFYNIEYLISTPSNGAQIQLLADNVLASTTNVPNNGSWESYESLNGGVVNLTAGQHTIRILASSNTPWQWNLDKIILTRDVNRSNDEELTKEFDRLEMYPNPSSGEVFLDGLDAELEYHIRIYDIKGTTHMNTPLNQNHTINIENLSKGIYFLSIKHPRKETKTLRLIRN